MKKITAILTAAAIATCSFAQSAEDAVMFSQEYYEGTARTMAMGNAFTAVGGDIGAISVNPASSGVYHYFQMAVTPSVTTTPYSSYYLGVGEKGNNTKMTLSNAGFVSCFDTGRNSGLFNFNLGVVYNKKASLNSLMTAAGQTDDSSMLSSIAASLQGIHCKDLEKRDGYNPYRNSTAPWRGILAWNTYGISTMENLDKKLFPGIDDEYIASTENFDPKTKEVFVADYLNQEFSRTTYGGIQEFALNFGMNFNDMLYLGANINMEAVGYTELQSYSERAVNPSKFQDGFVSMKTTYWRQTSGAGVNFKFGAIVTPVAGLRLGATFTTPTWYSLRDNWDYDMEVAFNNGKRYAEQTDRGAYDYKVTAPLRFSVGLAYTVGKFALISAEYERVSYGATRLKDRYGSFSEFDGENRYISSNYGASNIFRVGAEGWIGRFAIRGGYDRFGAYSSESPAVSFWSCGLGFKVTSMITLDAAFQRWYMGDRSFTLYDGYGTIDSPVGSVNNKTNKIAVTFALKF